MNQTTRIGLLAFASIFAACSSTGSGDPAPGASSGTPAPGTGTPGDGTMPPGTGQVDPGMDANPASAWNPPLETGAVAFPYTAYRCGYATRQVSPSKPSAIFHEDVSGSAPAAKNLHLTIAGNASSSVVVQWSTDDATHATEVRFGDTPSKLDKIAHGYSFDYGVAGRRQHEVHLCGLEAGRTFYYDAGGSKARSSVYKVTTAPDAASDVKVLVGGDTRTNPDVWANIAKVAIAQGATALVMTGDAVLSGGVQAQWDTLFEGAPDLFAQLPGIWAHGNHEGLDEAYFAQFALPDNGTSSGIEEWYATTYGPVRFVVLNDTVSSSSVITGTEKTFLDATLKAVDRTRTPFVVALHHQPEYTTSSGHPSSTSLRDAWTPLFDQYHVNAVLNGHVHSYESTKPMKGGNGSSIGTATTDALGTRYLVFGGGGADLYGFNATQSYIQMRESVHGFATLAASATVMTWTAFRADGSTLETITMPK
ncbi:MAG: metallophosphoesterase [Myxococcaceae bacterium]|nr:metallophosphoesterase [Myxococcaceae bacterium]